MGGKPSSEWLCDTCVRRDAFQNFMLHKSGGGAAREGGSGLDGQLEGTGSHSGHAAMHQSCIFHFKGFWLSFHALTFVPTCPDHTTNLDALVFPSCAVFPRKTLEAHEGI